MKKINKLIAITLTLGVLLTSCKSIKGVEVDGSIDTNQSNILKDEHKDNKKDNKPKESNVIINGDLVTIKVPKEFQYEGEVGELTPEKIQSGFIESKLNSDNSISYTMKKNSYDKYVKSFKDGIIFRFKTIQKGTTYKTIKKFDFNSDLTKAVFWVDKNTYYGSGEESAAKNVSREMSYYQIFSGISENELDVEVRIIDNSNQQDIEKIIY